MVSVRRGDDASSMVGSVGGRSVSRGGGSLEFDGALEISTDEASRRGRARSGSMSRKGGDSYVVGELDLSLEGCEQTVAGVGRVIKSQIKTARIMMRTSHSLDSVVLTLVDELTSIIKIRKKADSIINPKDLSVVEKCTRITKAGISSFVTGTLFVADFVNTLVVSSGDWIPEETSSDVNRGLKIAQAVSLFVTYKYLKDIQAIEGRWKAVLETSKVHQERIIDEVLVLNFHNMAVNGSVSLIPKNLVPNIAYNEGENVDEPLLSDSEEETESETSCDSDVESDAASKRSMSRRSVKTERRGRSKSTISPGGRLKKTAPRRGSDYSMDMRRGIEGAEAKKRKRKGLEKKKSKIEVLEAAHRAIVRRGGASAVSVEDTMQEMVLGVARKSGSSPTKLKFKAGTVFRAALKKAAQVVEERSSSGSGSWVAGDSLESKSSFRRGRFDEGDSEGGEGSVEIRVRRGAPHSKEGGVSAPDETGSLVSEVTTIMDEDGASHLSDTEFQVGGKRRVVVQPSHLRPITPPMPPPLSDKPEAFRSRSSSGESGEGAPDEVIVEVSDGKKKTSMLSQPQVDEIDSRDVMPRRTIPVTPPPPSSSDG